MAKKFVINDGVLILGDVELHEDLVKHRNKSKTIGGGRWFYDRDINTIYFYGKSIDFGSVTRQELDAAWKQPFVENAIIVFSEKELFDDVLNENREKL
jgi:hypothetical protein